MNSIKIKPAVPGTIVRNPNRGYAPLPDAGDIVPETMFWQRRLRAGDVVAVEEEKPQIETAAEDDGPHAEEALQAEPASVAGKTA
jgi:hypothetical protein